MTLSNFEWTDKDSVKWFILLPTGHEGPYSLKTLKTRKFVQDIQVWAEGLPSPVSLREALAKSSSKEDDLLPPLPSTEGGDDVPPPLPDSVTKGNFLPKHFGLLFGFLALLGFGLYQWIKSEESLSIHRLSKMSPEIHQRISQDLNFGGWNKKIFFKEYVPADLSQIWFVTSSFQACDVEAVFTSIKDKLLSLRENEIAFKSAGRLNNHVVEFKTFDFTSGSKLIPGMYEVKIKAFNCEWDGLAASVANLFKAPEPSYVSKMKVILYSKGAVEFNRVLDKFIRRKIERELKEKNQEELFWQDLQQKFQTLLAITLQMENFFIEFLETDTRSFPRIIKPKVDYYTNRFGGFLTKFVVGNEEYFNELSKSDLSNLSQKKSYEESIRLTAKSIGHEAMKLIEGLQKIKKPSRKDLNRRLARVKKVFKNLKDEISQKILKVTEDQSLQKID